MKTEKRPMWEYNGVKVFRYPLDDRKESYRFTVDAGDGREHPFANMVEAAAFAELVISSLSG